MMMTSPSLPVAIAMAFTFAPIPDALAADKKKKAPPAVTVKDLAIREAQACDANNNGRIEGPEVSVLRQAQRNNPNSYLYLFDDNSNNYLDDAEIAKIRFTPKKNPQPAKTAGADKKESFWKTPPAGSQMSKKKKK